MALMWRVAQPVDHPDIEPVQCLEALWRDGVDVRRIGQAADAEAQRLDIAVLEQEGRSGQGAALPHNLDRIAGLDAMALQDRRIVAPGRCLEAVAEPDQQV